MNNISKDGADFELRLYLPINILFIEEKTY